MAHPARVAIVGLGGFAGSHHRALLRLEEAGLARLVATCDPRPDDFAQARADLRFEQRGVAVYDDLAKLLAARADELDLVTLPVPIPLHAPMHRACVDRGLAVYLEKPPTLWWDELQSMIAVDRTAAKQTVVGFNWIVDPLRQATKQRLLDGEFGARLRVGVWGYWPRPASYYRRAAWAGQLVLDGRPVLDSPLGNALAHLTHNGLFWAGADLWQWAEPETVRAELYRAHAIGGMDTVFASADLAGGTEFRLALTHACTGTRQGEVVECERATLTYAAGAWDEQGAVQRLTIAWRDGREEVIEDRTHADYMAANLADYLAYLRGERPRPLTTLADSQAFVLLNNLAYLAVEKIVTVPAEGETPTIEGVTEAGDTFLATGRLPAEQGCPWARAGGLATRADLPRLATALAALNGA